MNLNKPELLAPAGSAESFYAAIEAGADAVYLGLEDFNARKRAKNFKNSDLPILLSEAHKNGVKVFIALNTVLKNSEIDSMVKTLSFLNRYKPDAVIIQDWGVYNIIKSRFPALTIHASTQMAIHNSIGAEYMKEKGFNRTILARELTIKEIETIGKTETEIELFIHGALCYSFSGMCHFSSFLGGYGANRGVCKQVCRRGFNINNKKEFVFNLKDNIQVSQIKRFSNAGIKSLKIEGRLKSDQYVYKVTKTYRNLIDKRINEEEAHKILISDTGREKTSYFTGADVKNAISNHTSSGFFLGKVIKSNQTSFTFRSNYNFPSLFRLRIQAQKSYSSDTLKVREYIKKADNIIEVKSSLKPDTGALIYLTGEEIRKFPQRLPKQNNPLAKTDKKYKPFILNFKNEKKLHQLYIRIDSLNWLKKIHFNNADAIIFSFNKRDWSNLNLKSGLIKNNIKKIWIELPFFIPEKKLSFYHNLIREMISCGIDKFVLSNISQKMLLPNNSQFILNENGYSYNDASIAHHIKEGALTVTYPVENDKENLYSYKYKNGIVPLYYYPRLFVSRMPVKRAKGEILKDDTDKSFKTKIVDGITYTIPETVVSMLQYKNNLKKEGFFRFLIDLSFEKPSSNKFKTLIKRYNESQQIQPSDNFNYKRTLQ
ncbi:U32 family peptidase [Marinilabiliaceae bacterium ANBcel2]|nr:U32 family peptidase [Marinilabiliaceae bacterium ANBcel2]